MNLNLDKRLVIAPSSLADGLLALRREHPEWDFLLYDAIGIEELLSYRYGNQALNFLLKEGMGLSKAQRTLSAISKLKDTKAETPFIAEMKSIEKRLLVGGVLHAHPDPLRLLHGYEPLVIGYPRSHKLDLLLKRIGYEEYECLPLEKKEIKAPYVFKDRYEEGRYLLNSLAALLKEGTKPEDIYIYGAKREFLDFIVAEAPNYGFGLPRKMPLSDCSSFKAFMKCLDEEGNDRDIFEDLVSKLKDHAGARELASVINAFEGLPLDRRRSLYLQWARGKEVSIPPLKDGPRLLSSFIVPEGSHLFVVDASFGRLPASRSEDPFFKDADKQAAGLPTSVDENEASTHEGELLLSSPSLVYASYDAENGEKSFLFPNDKKPVSAPIEAKDYSLDHGGLLQAFLLDEHEDTLVADPRLPSLLEQGEVGHASFPYDFQPFGLEINRPESYSYSSLKVYASCHFSYYLERVLHLFGSDSTFATLRGSFIHRVLELRGRDEIEKVIEKAFEESLEEYGKPLTAVEEVLMGKIKESLSCVLKKVNSFENLFAQYRPTYRREYSFTVEMGDGIKVGGKMDEAISYVTTLPFNVIVDFKTGQEPFNAELFSLFGLGAQLPIYALASSLDPELSGRGLGAALIFPVLPKNQDFVTEEETKELGLADNPYPPDYDKPAGLLLDDEVNVLSILDKEVKGTAKWTQDKKISTKFAGKKMETISQLIEKAKEYVKAWDAGILNGDFGVTPFEVKGDFHSCQYCHYRDVCYREDQKVGFYQLKKDKKCSDDREEDDDYGTD